MDEVIVIGAGIAGLAAANELAQAGLKTIVLEARDRIGGRISTIHDKKSSATIELGAEFVHGVPPEIFQTAEAAGIEIAKTEGNFYIAHGDRLIPAGNEPAGGDDAIWDKIEKYSAQHAQDISLDAFLKLPENASIGLEERDQLKRFVAGFHAAEIDKVGIKGLVKTTEAEESIGGLRGFRIPTGYDRLAKYLYESAQAAGARFLFKSKVGEINWSHGSVDVSIESAGKIQGRAAIITLPVGVLKAGLDSTSQVLFEPELTSKTDALSKIEMGDARRVTFLFKRKWWNDHLDKNGPTLGFLMAQDVPLSVWWSSEPMVAPILTGWTGGKKAIELAKLGNDAVINQAIDSLGKMFGVARTGLENEIVSVHTYDWLHDPFTLGAYTYPGVGGVDAQRDLAANIENTLYFAGEATSYEGHWGTVHGAIASGLRAARELISAS